MSHTNGGWWFMRGQVMLLMLSVIFLQGCSELRYFVLANNCAEEIVVTYTSHDARDCAAENLYVRRPEVFPVGRSIAASAKKAELFDDFEYDESGCAIRLTLEPRHGLILWRENWPEPREADAPIRLTIEREGRTKTYSSRDVVERLERVADLYYMLIECAE